MSDALLIAAHGSRDGAGVDEFRAFADAWQRLRPDRLQAAGFLEFARPTIGEALDSLVAQGARQITVVPAMLMAAGHVKNDVPSEIAEGRVRHPGVLLRMARPLDIHPALLELCQVRYHEALDGLPDVPPADSLLLLVGRGTSDPDANANIARVSRFLWESYGVAWASVAFAGLVSPSVDEALTVCRKLGYRRIIVQPYFLFDGILLKRISDAARRQAEADPSVQIVGVSHLRNHPLLLQAFEDRGARGCARIAVDELRPLQVPRPPRRPRGRPRSPQEGHHHHVRASSATDDDHDHRPRRPSRRPDLADRAGHAWDERLLERLQLLNS